MLKHVQVRAEMMSIPRKADWDALRLCDVWGAKLEIQQRAHELHFHYQTFLKTQLTICTAYTDILQMVKL